MHTSVAHSLIVLHNFRWIAQSSATARWGNIEKSITTNLASAATGVLDISEFFGETTGGVRTFLRQKARYVESRPDLRQVLARSAERLAPYMVPRAIELTDRLPTSPNGKVDYKRLARERSGDDPG
jgi:acyl-CoA synthetase (AMP-forming)/AMP-acid ligase II